MSARQSIRTLNRLVQTCRDGEAACAAWSAAVASPDLEEGLWHRSQEWGRQGDELQALVLLLGGRPARTATPAGRALRGWILLKRVFLGRSDLSVVLGWEQAQRNALRRYQHALEGTQPAQVHRTLLLQAARLSDHHHHLEDLVGRFAAHSY
ncbi:MAG TPA: PA2169 family four-helix-bundle protein [Steroidobacteraceae bacterium]